MSSRLRLVTIATLIVFGCVIGVGALTLFFTAAAQPPAGNMAISDAGPSPCKPQSWLPFDPSCLTRRDLPWISEPSTSRPAGDPDSLPQRSLTESPGVVPAPQDVRSETSVLALSPNPPVPPLSARQEAEPQAAVPQAAVRMVSLAEPQESVPQAAGSQALVSQTSLQQGPIAASKPPVQLPAAIERRAPKQKTLARQQRTAKSSTNDDLNGGRKKADNLQEVSVTSHTADGAKRTVVIRPTSVQDSYYYSVPR